MNYVFIIIVIILMWCDSQQTSINVANTCNYQLFCDKVYPMAWDEWLWARPEQIYRYIWFIWTHAILIYEDSMVVDNFRLYWSHLEEEELCIKILGKC